MRLTNNNRIWTFGSPIPMKEGIPDEHFWASPYQQGTSSFLHARIDLKIREILEKFTIPVGQRFWKHFWTISESRLYKISPYSPFLVCLKASNFGWVNSNNPSTLSKKNGAMLIASKNTVNATHISRERSFTFELIYLRFPKAWKLNVMSRCPWSNHFWTFLQHNIPISN